MTRIHCASVMLYILFGGISDNTDQPDSGASLSVTFRKDKVGYSLNFHFYSIECKTNRGSTLWKHLVQSWKLLYVKHFICQRSKVPDSSNNKPFLHSETVYFCFYVKHLTWALFLLSSRDSFWDGAIQSCLLSQMKPLRYMSVLFSFLHMCFGTVSENRWSPSPPSSTPGCNICHYEVFGFSAWSQVCMCAHVS